jgi:hypothetical protein
MKNAGMNFEKGTGLERSVPVIFTGTEFNFEKQKNQFSEIEMTIFVMNKEVCKIKLPMKSEASASEILGTVQIITLRALNEGEKKVIRNKEGTFIRFLKTGVQLVIEKKNEGKTDDELVATYGINSLIPYLVVRAELKK